MFTLTPSPTRPYFLHRVGSGLVAEVKGTVDTDLCDIDDFVQLDENLLDGVTDLPYFPLGYSNACRCCGR